MKLQTQFDYPPIPIRTFDWSCLDSDTFDADFDYEAGHFTTKCPVGHGATEEEAVFDFVMQLLEKAEISVSEIFSRKEN
jgi:hypothetical protein